MSYFDACRPRLWAGVNMAYGASGLALAWLFLDGGPASAFVPATIGVSFIAMGLLFLWAGSGDEAGGDP